MTVKELYDEFIRPLPTADRLQLAAMIVHELAASSTIDVSTDWSDEDMADLTAYSLKCFDDSL